MANEEQIADLIQRYQEWRESGTNVTPERIFDFESNLAETIQELHSGVPGQLYEDFSFRPEGQEVLTPEQLQAQHQAALAVGPTWNGRPITPEEEEWVFGAGQGKGQWNGVDLAVYFPEGILGSTGTPSLQGPTPVPSQIPPQQTQIPQMEPYQANLPVMQPMPQMQTPVGQPYDYESLFRQYLERSGYTTP